MAERDALWSASRAGCMQHQCDILRLWRAGVSDLCYRLGRCQYLVELEMVAVDLERDNANVMLLGRLECRV